MKMDVKLRRFLVFALVVFTVGIWAPATAVAAEGEPGTPPVTDAAEATDSYWTVDDTGALIPADENEYEIASNLIMFREIGVTISSFTTDGSDSIIRAIKYTHPHTLRQRCLVHIERECLSWLTQHPRTSAGITFRRIVRMMHRIRASVIGVLKSAFCSACCLEGRIRRLSR